MVQNLFDPNSARPRATSRSSARRSTSRQSTANFRSGAVDQGLFGNCVIQVQRNLKAAATAPSLMHTLASYYTRIEPYVEERPFCVSLSFATFLFHMQMARISSSDTDLYTQLVGSVLAQLTPEERQTHPFVRMVIHDRIFGLPSPSCVGSPHCVVLIPPQQYRAFRTMAASLIALEVLPRELVYQFHDRLAQLCDVHSPLVSNRALALLIETKKQVQLTEQANELRSVLRAKPVKINVDFLLACYERLKRITSDPSKGPTFIRALCISCSEIFLRFRSPIRREYVERFLYPSLCHEDMTRFLAIPETRRHLLRSLLRQCNPGLSSSNQYYLCICAVMQHSFDDEVNGALETVDLINTHMPHAAYFMSALAIDSRMSIPMFAKVIISLSRGAGLAMVGRKLGDEVAASISNSASSVYNVLYILREVVRSCTTSASRRSLDMLKALRVAVPPMSIEALGKLSVEAFERQGDAALEPELLCAEVAMVLHGTNLGDAVDSAVEYFKHAAQQCFNCGMQNSSLLICPVTHTAHVSGQREAGRVLLTLSECAGTKRLHEKLIQYLQEPTTQMSRAVHALVYFIIAHAGPYKETLFNAVQPYIRRTLLTLLDAPTTGFLITSEQRANILMLHVKLITLFTNSIDPSYFENTLKVFSELPMENNHDALCLWYMANILIRQSGPNLELLPTDPLENNYCIDFPGCAPATNVAAVNAQLVLKLLDKAHNYSAETRKLVGCCVCRLIQDYNMQAPNIVGALLSSFGFVTPQLTSLALFALPLGETSTFWSFFLQQMRSSAPARTALMAALARSVGRRFRMENPAAAVPTRQEETSAIFPVMVYEAMKRSPTISRVVLYMVSQWLKQNSSTPGKFATLLYTSTQLICVVESRFDGAHGVDMEAETESDRRIFKDAVDKAVKNVEKMAPRLQRLIDAASRNNEEFFHLLRRLERRVRFTIATAAGEEFDEVEEPLPRHFVADAASEWQTPPVQPAAELERFNEGSSSVVPLWELQNPQDDWFMDQLPLDAASPEESTHSTAPTLEPTRGGYRTSAMASPPLLERRTRGEPSSRSQSRGVQTGETDEAIAATEKPSHADHSHTLPYQNSSIKDNRDTGSFKRDKAVTAPAQYTVGTSPIQPGNPHSSDTSTLTHRAEVEDVTSSSWYEPSVLGWSSLDIAGVPKPASENQVETVPGQVPSAMIMQYLMDHQGLDSVRYEMAQLQNPRVSENLFSERVVSQYSPSIPVAMPIRPNNYSKPHVHAAGDADNTVMAPVRMVGTNPSPLVAAPPPPPSVSPVSVVDGETALLSVSEEVRQDEKRLRMEHLARPVRPVARGMEYFLQQQSGGGLEDVVSWAPPALPGTRAEPVRIPTCLVEQNNETTLREVRQAMGTFHPNTVEAEERGSALKDRRRSKAETERSSSTAWWAEMSGVPVPGYAADPQYSMELF